ncbi:hypothetical protein M3Y99_00771800 [Aphelenchoides fujianensis]|nr:hypothetical protein M3Y99_00771800 [Aphelenchoides fujianensis]
MPQRGRSTSSKLPELSKAVPELVRKLESETGVCKRSAVIDQLVRDHNASREQANQAIEWAVRQQRVVELFTHGSGEPVLHDILRFKVRRPLRLNADSDLTNVLRLALEERGSRSSQNARSVSELHDHIMTTYSLAENSVMYLSACLDRALKLLIERDQVEEKVPLNDNETRYFLTSLSSTPNGPQAVNPSLATTSGENKKDENVAHPPASRAGAKDKRHVEQAHHNDCSKSELKSLQDSLSQFFTPTNSRRSRVAQSSFSAERFNAEKELKLRSPLEVVVPNSHDGIKRGGEKTGAPHDLNVSPGGSTPSPNRRHADKLVDSLSPYFAASADRRRKQHEKGQYLQLCNGGVPPKKKARTSESSSEMNGHFPAVLHHSKNGDFDQELSDSEVEPLVELKVNDQTLTSGRKAADFSATTSPLPTANSTAEIEVPRYSPGSHKKRSSLRTSDGKKAAAAPLLSRAGSSGTLNGLKSRTMREKTLMARVSNNLLKRARNHCNAKSAAGSSNQTAKLRRRAGSMLPTTPKKSRAAAQPVSSTIVKHTSTDSTKILQSPIRRAFLLRPSRASS